MGVRVSSSSHSAEIAQLVEHNLAKVGVASSSLVFRSHLDKLNHFQSPGGGMVDALVSGASVSRRAGSSPVLGTRIALVQHDKLVVEFPLTQQYKHKTERMERWRNW